jgi:FixJ family two-component response regulator/glycine cleavage system H lipoate-binding protein
MELLLLLDFHLLNKDKNIMSKEHEILVIDDEQVIIDAVIKIGSIDNYSVDSAINVTTAIEKISKHFYPIIVCDIMMPDGNGFQILDELHNRNIGSAVIMMTGYSTVENAVNSLYKGAVDFIPKPFTVDELLNSIFRAKKYLDIIHRVKESYKQKQPSELVYVNCPSRYSRLGYSGWLFKESEGSVLIGVCDLFLKTIESLKEIEFMNPEDEVMQGIACATLVSVDERSHKILAPVSGRIVEVNEELKGNVSLIEKDPFFKGWLYRLIPEDLEYESKSLIPCSSDR